jgi:hypothetical protein
MLRVPSTSTTGGGMRFEIAALGSFCCSRPPLSGRYQAGRKNGNPVKTGYAAIFGPLNDGRASRFGFRLVREKAL